MWLVSATIVQQQITGTVLDASTNDPIPGVSILIVGTSSGTTTDLDEGFDPEFAQGELLAMLTEGTSTGRKWYLDGEGNPVNWLASGIGWTNTHEDSYN